MINTGRDIAQVERFNNRDAGMGQRVMVLQRFRIDFIYGREIQSQQFDAIFLQPRWDISGDHRNLLWKQVWNHSIGRSLQGVRDVAAIASAGRPEVLDGDQVFLLRVEKSLPKIDHRCAAQIRFERRFLN